MAALLAQGRAVFFRGCLIGVGQPRFFYSKMFSSRLVNAEKEHSYLLNLYLCVIFEFIYFDVHKKER